MTLFLPVPLAGVLFGKPVRGEGRNRMLKTGFLALCVIVIVISLWFSNSRGALAGAVASALALLILRANRKGAIVAGILAVTLAAYLWWVGPAAALNLLTLSGAKEGPEYRMEIWSRAWYIIQDFSFTGVGMGSFEPV